MASQAIAEEVSADVERIEITGSRIKRTDMESATPVTVLSAEDMAKQGFTNVQDALESLTATTGAMTGQEIHGFTPAASSISLRGAGASRTLTLINGKRLNQYPKPAGGSDNFVDTANLPMEAVARIEVLNSGASAIYGADAVGGVVNIILKRDFDGVALKYRKGVTQNGGGGNDRIALSIGSSSDKGNVSTFIELTDNQRLRATDRENFGLHTDKVDHPRSLYSSYGARINGLSDADKAALKADPDYADAVFSRTPFTEDECNAGGFFWTGSTCGFDRSTQRDLSPESTRFISTTTFNYELSDDVRFIGRMDIAQAKSITRIESMGDDSMNVRVNDDGQVILSTSYNGEKISKALGDKSVALGGDFADLGAGSYNYVRRLHEFGPRTGETKSTNYFFSSGLEGDLADYAWDASVNYGRTEVDVLRSGYATAGGMFEYLTQGDNGVSYLQGFSAEDVENIAYNPFEKASSTLLNAQANITGSLAELEAGYIDFAFGVEWSRQDYNTDSDSESKKGAILTTGGSSGTGERSFWATYFETIVPITDEVLVNAALRYDRYSDFGGNLTPQVSVEYRPTLELLVRGSIGGVFRAPDMHRVYGDPTNGYSTIQDYKTCTENGGTPGDLDNPAALQEVCNGYSVSITTGANKELKAETGYTANLGTVYSGEQWNLSVDLWQWKLDDMVDSIAAATAAKEFKDYEDMLTRDDSGKIIHVNATAQNLAYQKVTGLDFEAGYDFDLGEMGDLRLFGNGTYNIDSETQLSPTDPIRDNYEYGWLTRYRVNANLAWFYGNLEATLAARHIGPMKEGTVLQETLEDGTKVDIPKKELASWTSWNLTAVYHLGDNAKLTAGIVNLFDKGPNFDPTASSWPHYPRSVYNARGREFFLEGEVKF
ncbi:TonB-dependent receptor [Paraferrimonas sedimenticola]|uniref:TonB-dependent receptor n=2 Tax=Paraferrimonas sedimenticola TaxID=375674 RepID=A0AA37RWY9_9GAMM|nr:TonB-dependent receptor [Paraferrimonas sedimenticola]